MSQLQVVREWAGWCYQPGAGHDKVWAGAVFDSGHFVALWGARATRYQHKDWPLGYVGAASRQLDAKIREKTGRGYQAVAFNDPAAGDIPSFSAGLGRPAIGPAPAGPITIETWEASLAAFEALVGRPAPSEADTTRLLLEWERLQLLGEVLRGTGRTEALARNARIADHLTTARAALRAYLLA